MRFLIPLATVLVTILLPTPALAWWEYGHQTVAAIALHEVRPATRAAMRRLIAHASELATPTCPIRNLADASVWPDCIKGLHERFSYTSAWHYQDVDVCAPFDLTAACRDGNCVSAQITRNAALLADRTLPPRERLMALAFLVHFVGDLHQPLHAGERHDRGGNDLRASYGIASSKRMNIHSIWDGYLADRAISTPPAGATGLLTALSADDRARIAGGTVTDWSRESAQVSHDSVYGVVLPSPCGAPEPKSVALTEAQITALVPVVRLQIERGGLRLARLLDQALASRR